MSKLLLISCLSIFVFCTCQSKRLTNVIINHESSKVTNIEDGQDTLDIITLTGDLFLSRNFKIIDLINIEYDKREIIVMQDTVLIHRIQLPTKDEFNGFSVNWIKECKGGFQISIEYGTRYYFEKDFYFYFNKEEFYLRKIIVIAIDKQSSNLNKSDSILITPGVRINDFSITDYMKD